MKMEFLEELVEPVTGHRLSLAEAQFDSEGRVEEGLLAGEKGQFPIVRGIPRFAGLDQLAEQAQTHDSFSYKWSRAESFYTQQRTQVEDRTFQFMVETEPERYGFKDIDEMRSHYGSAKRILEVGCGSGHYTALYLPESFKGTWIGADLSTGIEIARQRLRGVPGTNFVQADLFHLPLRERSFDIVHCRGVMHHTPSTRSAFDSVARYVKPGGEFVFLIYRKNGPLREFSDDYIREQIMNLPAEEAWEKLMALTRLGKALSQISEEIDVPEDVELLGIKAGKYNVQRLIYQHFLKAFWKPDWSEEESNIISYDWYHPQYVFRHTPEEIYQWCSENELEIESFDDRWVGFTVRARKHS